MFELYFSLCVLLIMLVTVYKFSFGEDTIIDVKNVGELQNNLVGYYSKGEEDLSYINKLIEYVLIDTTKDFHNIEWFVEGKDINLKEEFLILFKDKFNNRSSFVFDSNDFKIDKNILIFNSSKNLIYHKQGDNYEINYEVKPKFEKEIPFDLDKFVLLREEIKNKRDCLEKSSSNDLKSCINNMGLDLSVNKIEDVVEFTLIGDKEIYILEDNKLKKDKPIFKFSLDLSIPGTF